MRRTVPAIMMILASTALPTPDVGAAIAEHRRKQAPPRLPTPGPGDRVSAQQVVALAARRRRSKGTHRGKRRGRR